MLITRTSIVNDQPSTRDIPVTYQDLRSWTDGAAPIQTALGHLSVEDREFLITGITPEQWEDLKQSPPGVTEEFHGIETPAEVQLRIESTRFEREGNSPDGLMSKESADRVMDLMNPKEKGTLESIVGSFFGSVLGIGSPVAAVDAADVPGYAFSSPGKCDCPVCREAQSLREKGIAKCERCSTHISLDLSKGAQLCPECTDYVASGSCGCRRCETAREALRKSVKVPLAIIGH